MDHQNEKASQVLCETDGGVATLTINRPDSRNALGASVIEEILEHLDRISKDDEIKVVVVTGAGDRVFCAGGDLKDFQGGGFIKKHQVVGLFPKLFQAMNDLGKPLVGRVNGHALGGGFGLMLACDIVIASEEAQMGTPEIRVGLFPMMVLAQLFRNIGRKKGMELILTGEQITATEAQKLGLINYAVPASELDGAVEEMCDKLKKFSPAILKLGRDAFYNSADMHFDEALDYLQNMLTINLHTEDAAEGIAAFLEKRKPEWKGK